MSNVNDANAVPSLVAAVNHGPQRKAAPYSIKSATGPVAGGGVVGFGINVKAGPDQVYLVFEDGREQRAVTAQTIAAAIYHGVISREQVTELWAAADAAASPPPPAMTPPPRAARSAKAK